MEDAYGTSGLFADLVTTVVQQCSCAREHAVAALKVFGNNVEQATASIATSRHRSRPGRTLPLHIEHNDKLVIPTPSPADKGVDNGPGRQGDARSGQGSQNSPQLPGSDNLVLDGLEVVTPENSARSDLQKFQLPKLRFVDPLRPFTLREAKSRRFSLERLTCAVQHGLSHDSVKKYLSHFSSSMIAESISGSVGGVPSVFFAVETNNCSTVRTWVECGADVNVREPRTRLPLLAFAIINSARLEDSMSVVLTLLALGADASVIPDFLFEKGAEDGSTPDDGHQSARGPAETDHAWCNHFFAKEMASSISVSQKYFIRRRLRLSIPSGRMAQAAKEHNFAPLFGLPFAMVGQDMGIGMLVERLRTYLITPINTTVKPLVLIFAGPSGHGKTELGQRLGNLLSLHLMVEDMTQVKHESDLFGPNPPYMGFEKGSKLNNFLADNSGKRAVVMLDEIEKASPGVLNSLLIVLDEGRYQDRRSGSPLDCRKIIWILATNSLDRDILDFDESVLGKQLLEKPLDLGLKNKLQERLVGTVKSKFGSPLSGRISAIIPFLPFSSEEQMTIAHKLLLEFKAQLHQPIATHLKQLIGSVNLKFAHESALCQKLTKHYDRDRGARSIAAAVENEIRPRVVGQYLEANERIESGQPVEDYVLDLSGEGHFIVHRDDKLAS